jgi:hypothetical protein
VQLLADCVREAGGADTWLVLRCGPLVDLLADCAREGVAD